MTWEPVDPDDALPPGPRNETVKAKIRRLAAELHNVCYHDAECSAECDCPCSRCRA